MTAAAHALPHSPEAEAALVGAMILDPSIATDAIDAIRPVDFHLGKYRAVFEAVGRLRKQARPIDLVSVHAEVGDEIPVNVLASTVETVPSASNWREYARVIKRCAHRRRILELSLKLSSKSKSGDALNGEIEELAEAGRALAADNVSDLIADATPAIELMTQELTPLEYVLAPLASIGNLTILQGEPKGGKSCFALLIALCVSLGKWPAGRFASDGVLRSTLVITYEDGKRRIRKRLNQYAAGMGDPLHPVLPVHLAVYTSDNAPQICLDTPDGVERLRAVIAKHGARFVVIDTLSHITAGDENAKKEMQPVMNALKSIARELQCAIVVLHHTSKPGKDGAKSIVYRSRGSSAIAAAADVIIDWGDRSGTNVTPCSMISKDDDGDRFDVEYLPDGDDIVRWRIVDHEDATNDKYGTRKAIIEALGRLIAGHPGGVSRQDITRETSLARPTVARHLSELVKEGSIQRIESRDGDRLSYLYAPITHVFVRE